MKSDFRFNRNQLLSLSTVILLSPALRLYPAGSVAYAGRAAWLSAPAALPIMLLYALLLCRLMAARQEGEGLAELTLRALGEGVGRVVLALYAGWLLLYGGFVLRSGADRLVVTIYPESGSAVFTIVMGLLGTLAALGSARTLARTAKLVLPLVLGALLLILCFAMKAVEKANLLPLVAMDAGPTLLGALPVVDVLALGLYLGCFFGQETVRESRAFRAWGSWLAAMVLLLTLLCVAVVGRFGAELTLELTKPFFSLVRNLVFFRTLERIEALVVTLWVFPDFLLISLLLYAAQHCLRHLMGGGAPYQGEHRLDLHSGRWVIPLCGLVVIAIGLRLAPGPDALELWSARIIPTINLCVAFGLIPLVYLVGKSRKKL